MKVKSHKAKRGSKTVVVKSYEKKDPHSRNFNSSFLEKIVEREDGKGYDIVIRGKHYPYPFLPDNRVGGVIRGTNGSSGRYYNRNIKGNYY